MDGTKKEEEESARLLLALEEAEIRYDTYMDCQSLVHNDVHSLLM